VKPRLETFYALTHLLSTYRTIWSESPFVLDELSWETRFPELHQTLIDLSEERLASLAEEANLLNFLGDYLPELQAVEKLQFSGEVRRWTTPQNGLYGMPGRKQNQTEGFVSHLLPFVEQIPEERTVVDWCSGKGLLARQVSFAWNAPVVCLERDASLCESGRKAVQSLDPQLAHRMTFKTQDVLCPVGRALFETSHLHTALHACGDLHLTMLRQTVEYGVPMVACSPCCFHLIEADTYSALSEAGRRSELNLTRQELRLATAETCTAGSCERTLRHRELLWRIAFDLRLREVTGIDAYTATPSVKKSVLKSDFATFARTLMKSKGWDYPEFFPHSDDLWERAKARLARVRRLEKARLGFRKALEYWLLLDRALFLEEHGYECHLRQFCPKEVSGRNTLIVGVRKTS